MLQSAVWPSCKRPKPRDKTEHKLKNGTRSFFPFSLLPFSPLFPKPMPEQCILHFALYPRILDFALVPSPNHCTFRDTACSLNLDSRIAKAKEPAAPGPSTTEPTARYASSRISVADIFRGELFASSPPARFERRQ